MAVKNGKTNRRKDCIKGERHTINRLEINNLKCIKNMQMACGNLNVLIGTNSSGKSTIQQALLLMGQNLETIEGLNGRLVDLGNFEDAKCIYSAEKELEITLYDDNNHFVTKKFRLDSGTYAVYGECDTEEGYEELAEHLSTKNRNLQYLSCHRIGPCKVYKKNMTLDDVIGIDGEYAMSYLNQLSDCRAGGVPVRSREGRPCHRESGDSSPSVCAGKSV